MRDKLWASLHEFIRGVQEHNESLPDVGPRMLLTLSSPTTGPSLMFGYGYFDSSKVLYTPNKESADGAEELDVETAVIRFLKAETGETKENQCREDPA